MDSKLFRKASIDRLSSPEELDQIIKISNSGSWAALVGILLVCSATGVWAVTAGLPTSATGQAIIVRSGGVINVVARGSGVIRSIDVAIGQHVTANQVIARIAQPTLVEKLRGMQDSIAELGLKRGRDRKIKADQVGLQIESLRHQRTNTERVIRETQQQAKLAADQIPVMTQLFERGLVTNQQVIAAQQKLVELQGQVEDRRAQVQQLQVQEAQLQSEIAALEADVRFEASNRQREITAATTELAMLETVTTPYAGEVLEIKVFPGGTITTDSAVISIQPDSDTLEALTYVSALQAKDVRPGMEARVSPSTVKREEYGFIRAKVLFVAEYPATTAALMRNFQNDRLVSALADHGPVTEVRVALELNPKTASGFRWSSSEGPPVKISAGTLGLAEIVTETRAPITLVIPLLRQTFGL